MQLKEDSIICYSKQKTMRGLRVAGAFITLGILLPIIFSNDAWAYFFGVIIVIASTLIGLNIYKYCTNKQPQIIVNSNGIQTSKILFSAWKDIKGEDVVEISEGRTTGYYLIYDCPFGHAKHSLSFLDTNYSALSSVLKMYRDQSRQDEAVVDSTSLEDEVS